MSIVGAFIVPHPPIVLPEVGRGEERKIQNTIDAYNSVSKQIEELEPDTIVVVSPHAVMYMDYIHISPGENASGDLRQFGVGSINMDVKLDSEFVDMLSKFAEKAGLPAGTKGKRNEKIDHGTLVPLRFLNQYTTNYKLVRIGISGLPYIDHYNFGMCISQTAEKLGRRTVLIASGDLSHRLKEDGPYGYAPEGPAFDKEIISAMEQANFIEFLNFNPIFSEAAGECGLRSFIIMAGALDGKAVKPEFLSYEGTFGVGYAVCAYKITGEDHDRHFGEIYQKEHK